MSDSPSPGPTPAGAGGFRIQLPAFEGPLDLLLHLIQEHRLDIFDIPIAFVTEKYLEYLDRMRELDLDVAGQFLAMAATLAHIKSRMLLPRDERPEDDSAPDGVGPDPREELVRRLLELQKYREAARALGERPVLGRDVFAREAERERQAAVAPESPGSGVAPLAEVSVFKLIDLFDRALKRTQMTMPHEVVVERMSVAQRITELVDALAAAPSESVKFEELLEEGADKGKIVVTFLALLEMTRLKLVRIHQVEASVWVTRAADLKPEGGEVLDLGYR